jgi:hypothetical protein
VRMQGGSIQKVQVAVLARKRQRVAKLLLPAADLHYLRPSGFKLMNHLRIDEIAEKKAEGNPQETTECCPTNVVYQRGNFGKATAHFTSDDRS